MILLSVFVVLGLAIPLTFSHSGNNPTERPEIVAQAATSSSSSDWLGQPCLFTLTAKVKDEDSNRFEFWWYMGLPEAPFAHGPSVTWKEQFNSLTRITVIAVSKDHPERTPGSATLNKVACQAGAGPF